jgi:3-dehydroquinate synthase
MTLPSLPPSSQAAISARIPVDLGARSYEILIQDGLLDRIGQELRRLGMNSEAIIISNPVVKRLYGARVLKSLKAEGLRATIITVPEGEQAKSMKWLNAILDELLGRRCERNTWLLALGGGVVGDLAGLAASTYLRGIPLVQVPTTLVAQVDASIGGKTGVNHRLGKNLIGTFYQPRTVLIDPLVLKTLPVREYRAGLAEVIKYGVIADKEFFEFLEQHIGLVLEQESQRLHRVLQTSCSIKALVVSADEREGNRRRILNFGHTVGHALETVTGYRRYKHGEAVALGMIAASRLSVELGLSDDSVARRIRTLVRECNLPTDLPNCPAGVLIRVMRQDKKVKDQQIYFVLPTEIGHVTVLPVQDSQIRGCLTSTRRSSRPARSSRLAHAGRTV